jgi:hypothetical protein
VGGFEDLKPFDVAVLATRRTKPAVVDESGRERAGLFAGSSQRASCSALIN